MNPLEILRNRRTEVRSQIDAARDRANHILSLSGDQLTEDLLREASELRTTLVRLNQERDEVDAQILDGQAEESRRQQTRAAQMAAGTLPTASPSGARSYGGARVTYEARTYRPADHFTPGADAPSYFTDLYRVQTLNDPAAGQRLAQHGREVEVDGRMSTRALTSSGSTAFVPPAYLQDQWAGLVRAGRAVADRCTMLPLPAVGMTVSVPKVSTGATATSQATENSGLSNTDMTSTAISVPVVTIAGMQDVSRQLVERSDPGMDRVIFADLAAAYAAELDRQIVNGSGASGQMLGILNVSGTNAVTFTNATPTPALAWPKLADAAQRINALRFAAADSMVMAPRRWGWFLASLDGQNRPWLVPAEQGPNNAVGVQTSADYGQVVGSMMNVPVVTDANVPTNRGAGTNEDAVIVARLADCVLMEDNGGVPAQLRFDQPLANQLTVRLVAYNYAAFTAARQPQGISIVSGTGLVTPTF